MEQILMKLVERIKYEERAAKERLENSPMMTDYWMGRNSLARELLNLYRTLSDDKIEVKEG